MIRGKILKLIVGTVTTMFFTTLTATHTQQSTRAVEKEEIIDSFSDNNNSREPVVEQGVGYIDENTTESDIKQLIASSVVKKIVVRSGTIKMTESIVLQLKSRNNDPLTFELLGNSILEFQSSPQLTYSNKITIARGEDKRGALISLAKTAETQKKTYSVSYFTFDNRNMQEPVFNSDTGSSNVDFSNNTLVGGGYLFGEMVNPKAIAQQNKIGLSSISYEKAIYTTKTSILNRRDIFTTGQLVSSGGVKLKDNTTINSTQEVAKAYTIDKENKIVEEGELFLTEEKQTEENINEKTYIFESYLFDKTKLDINGGTGREGENKERYLFLVFYDESGNKYLRYVDRFNDEIPTTPPVTPTPPTEPEPPVTPNPPTEPEEPKPEQPKPPTNPDKPEQPKPEEPKPEQPKPPVTPNPPSGGGTIGGGSSSSSGISGTGGNSSSSSSSSITSNDVGKSNLSDVDAELNIGSATLSRSMKDGSDFKTNYEGVTATYENGKLTLKGLIPGKEYKDLTVTYKDKDSNLKTVKIAEFKTKEPTTNLKKFIVDVYKTSLDRQADEKGFAYWEEQLKDKKVSSTVFVKNLINEKEFISKYKTTSDKIKGLYQVIVNRDADTQGLNYWTEKYNDLLKTGNSESTSLNSVVDEMLSQQEFQKRVSTLDL